MTQKRVAIAGSSGSIGTQTIEVVLAEPHNYRVTALAVGSSADVVIAQAKQLQPELVVVTDEAELHRVAAALPGVEVTHQLSDIVDVADVVINGVVGFAGLCFGGCCGWLVHCGAVVQSRLERVLLCIDHVGFC